MTVAWQLATSAASSFRGFLHILRLSSSRNRRPKCNTQCSLCSDEDQEKVRGKRGTNRTKTLAWTRTKSAMLGQLKAADTLQVPVPCRVTSGVNWVKTTPNSRRKKQSHPVSIVRRNRQNRIKRQTPIAARVLGSHNTMLLLKCFEFHVWSCR